MRRPSTSDGWPQWCRGPGLACRPHYREPVQVGVTYIPAVLVADAPLGQEKKSGPGSIHQRFEDLGHPIARIREEVSARMPTPDEVKGLAMPPGMPVLDVLHTSVDVGWTGR